MARYNFVRDREPDEINLALIDRCGHGICSTCTG